MIGDVLPNPGAKRYPQQTLGASSWLASHLEIALNFVEEAIVKTDSKGIISWHNGAFVRLLDPEQEASQPPQTSFSLCGESLIEKLPLVHHQVSLSYQEHPVFLSLSHDLKPSEYQFHRQGKILILEITGLKLEPLSAGEVLFIIRDVTEHKLIERLINNEHLTGNDSLAYPLNLETSDSGSSLVPFQQSFDLNTFYESVTSQLSNYAAVGRLAHLFTQMMLQLKIHEQESKKAKDQLQAVLNAVPGLISWIRSDETYLGVNYHLARMFKLVPQDFIGKRLGFIKEDTRMNEFLRDFIASTKSYDYTTVELQIDRDLRHYIIAVQKYDAGNAIVAVGIDITEQKRIEEALTIAEENYRSIFENSLEGIFQSTLEGQYIRVNPALAKIYGYDSPEEMIAAISNIGEQIYVDLQERQDFIHCLDQQDTVKGFEYRCYKKDRSIVWVQVDARVVRDNSGQILYYEGTVQDINDRKKRESELQQQIANLKIEIDHQKREEEVLNLTATSYFQQVKQAIEYIDLDDFWS